ncbi:MAG: helical backbone metal receptor [Actinomycetota bacterium]|nr:helical backbone metal receptor [Actinomycetota bacterium]
MSLVPSVTETLLAWGIEPVAVTRFCEQPGLRAVGGTKNPDLEAIAAIAPDLVVLDKEENNLADAEALADRGIDLHVTHVCSVADVAPTMARLASAVGAQLPGARQLDRSPVAAEGSPRVWVPIWRRPWMSINRSTYGSSILAAVDLHNVNSDAEIAYPVTTLEEAVAARPDAVLAPSEPYAFAERHRSELETVAPVTFVDGKDLFWWGVRTSGALDRLEVMAGGLQRLSGNNLFRPGSCRADTQKSPARGIDPGGRGPGSSHTA